MSEEQRSKTPLILMIVFYALLILGSCAWFLMGLMFGSEAYRGRPMPLHEWAAIAGPLVVSGLLLVATIWLWNKHHQTATYVLFAGTFVVFALLFLPSGVFGI